jgi:HAD superfamily hydrolase (TIGR01509 family)
MAVVFLDLYGVLADGKVMDRAYNERMAEILHRRYGGALASWREIQLASYAWYQGEGAKLDARPGHEREGDAWVEAVRRMNADQVRWMFDRAGFPMPPDPVRFAEDLEAETVRGIDALFPDVRPALAAMRASGHRLCLSTNANRSNAESALIGGGVRDLFDGLAMLETARAKKDRPYYWRRAFELVHAEPADAWVVDDVARFLAPASDLGARCVQLVRPGMAREHGPHPVIDSLAALPGLL